MGTSSSDRPVRRSTRRTKAAEPSHAQATSSSSASKRKADAQEPAQSTRKPRAPKTQAEQLDHLLTNTKSALTTTDILEIVNANAWSMLSQEARADLVRFLPPTAFVDFVPTVHPFHPGLQHKPQADPWPPIASSSQTPTSAPPVPSSSHTHPAFSSRSLDTLDPAVFTDAHFVAATQTWQDQLYSGFFTEKHKERIARYEQGVKDGTLHAPWKDEAWESEMEANRHSADRAGDAKELKLPNLAEHGVVQVGDVVAYSRHFPTLNVTVEKDLLIEGIHPRNFAITLSFRPGTEGDLPMSLLGREPAPVADMQSITVTNPSMLETAVLDSDGRVPKGVRPSGNAWKNLAVFRWPEFIEHSDDILWTLPKGGRESQGTLFYLRDCLYNDP